jgi:hypothetical protein
MRPAAAPLSPSDLLVVAALVTLYVVPTVVALARGCWNVRRVVRVNLVYGWTGIGWLAAFVAACTGPRAARRRS